MLACLSVDAMEWFSTRFEWNLDGKLDGIVLPTPHAVVFAACVSTDGAPAPPVDAKRYSLEELLLATMRVSGSDLSVQWGRVQCIWSSARLHWAHRADIWEEHFNSLDWSCVHYLTAFESTDPLCVDKGDPSRLAITAPYGQWLGDILRISQSSSPYRVHLVHRLMVLIGVACVLGNYSMWFISDLASAERDLQSYLVLSDSAPSGKLIPEASSTCNYGVVRRKALRSLYTFVAKLSFTVHGAFGTRGGPDQCAPDVEAVFRWFAERAL